MGGVPNETTDSVTVYFLSLPFSSNQKLCRYSIGADDDFQHHSYPSTYPSAPTDNEPYNPGYYDRQVSFQPNSVSHLTKTITTFNISINIACLGVKHGPSSNKLPWRGGSVQCWTNRYVVIILTIVNDS